MGAKIIDNFLPEEQFAFLQEQMFHYSFPWYYHPGTSDSVAENIYDFHFVHAFYVNNSWSSDLAGLLNPVIQLIKPKAIVRIKANFTTPATEQFPSGWHTDYDFKCTTAVMYINDNDGYTEFENGDKVESVANRFVTFDSRTRHRAVNATNSSERVVINFNYFP